MSKSVFEKDDYSELDSLYFKKLRQSKEIFADPSGWIDTYSNVVNSFPKFKNGLQGYHTDISNQLNKQKKFFIDLISEWDESPFSFDNITLCSSTTVGSVIVMSFLISRGIRNIVFETPNYFATYYQAESMGLNITRIPTYAGSNFKLELDYNILRKHRPCAIWLTQPRTALGINQRPEDIRELLDNISKKDFIVIDEATEQYFPSILASINPQHHAQVIKIRSVVKGLGINGIRIAYITHHNSYRSDIAEEMEIFLGALDFNSIEHGVEICRDIPKFKLLLSIANNQVVSLRKKAEKLLLGTNCNVSPIENGYIGTATVNFIKNGNSRSRNRNEFIKFCAVNKVPVILGSAMGFATHKNAEFVRLNFFNRPHNILNGLKIISSFSS